MCSVRDLSPEADAYDLFSASSESDNNAFDEERSNASFVSYSEIPGTQHFCRAFNATSEPVDSFPQQNQQHEQVFRNQDSEELYAPAHDFGEDFLASKCSPPFVDADTLDDPLYESDDLISTDSLNFDLLRRGLASPSPAATEADQPDEKVEQRISVVGNDETINEKIRSSDSPVISPNVQRRKTYLKSEIEIKPLESILSQLDLNFLTRYGLSTSVARAYFNKFGIKSLYPWQKSCLEECSGVLQGENLVYSAPTSGGKTLVAEIVMIKRVTELRRKALFVLPYVAVVEEKASYFTSLLEQTDLLVSCHAGRRSIRRTFGDIVVCTIEKANAYVNDLISKSKLDQIATVIIDEAHMMEDTSRGYILELLLTKLIYASKEIDLQLLVLSATLPNAWELANWIGEKTHYFATDFRPVPLKQYAKVGESILDTELNTVRSVLGLSRKDTDGLGTLVAEVVKQGHQVLVFCATKRLCEATATHLSDLISAHGTEFGASSTQLHANELFSKLRHVPGGIEPLLEKALHQGVGYHHAGLTLEEREALEHGYRSGLVKVLCSTTTLAAGVNLPARRVIFRSLRVGMEQLDIICYRQACGRAGRAGLDTVGESYLMGKENDKGIVARLLQAALPRIQSALRPERCGLTRALLEAVSLGLVRTVYDIQVFITKTFFSHQSGYAEVHAEAQHALRFLEQWKVIQWLRTPKLFESSLLGAACVAASIPPEQAITTFKELERARENFVISDELHLLYFVVPSGQLMDPPWGRYYTDVYQHISHSHCKTAIALGVDESLLLRIERVGLPKETGNKTLEEGVKQKIHTLRRFYVALILQDVVSEMELAALSSKYGISRGEIQKLMETASTYCSMLSTFCEKLNWWLFASAFDKVTQRLKLGVQNELLNVIQIPSLRPWRARLLYKKGYRSLEEIATAEVEDVENIFRSVLPFDATESARKTEARQAATLIQDARRILHQEALDLKNASEGVSSPLRSRDVAASESIMRASKRTRNRSLSREREENDYSESSSTFSGDKEGSNSDAILSFGSDDEAFTGGVHPRLESESDISISNHINNVLKFSYTALSEILERVDSANAVGIHLNLHRNDCHYENMLSFSVTKTDGDAFVALVDTNDREIVAQYLLSWLQNSTCAKFCFHWKEQLKSLYSFFQLNPYTVPEFSNVFDIHVACGLIHPSNTTEEPSLENILTYFPTPLSRIAYKPYDCVGNQSNAKHGDMSFSHSRGSRTAFLSLIIGKRMQRLMKLRNLTDAFQSFEMPLVEILAAMEWRGIAFSADNYNWIAWQMKKRVERLLAVPGPSEQSHNTVRCRSRNSIHVTSVEKRHQSGRRKLKSSYSGDKLLHVLKEYNVLTGWLQNYIIPLPRKCSADGRLHGEFLQSGTVTGRLSMSEPNLQTIPHAKLFNFDEKEVTVDLRRSFLASKGSIFLSVDYSHVELRVLAHYSDDIQLKNQLLAKEDIFSVLACEIMHCTSPDAVTFEERRKVKTVCYGIIYGRGKKSLAKELEITVEEAHSLIDKFTYSYPAIESCKTQILNQCRKSGYVETFSRRRRYLADINSRNETRKRAAERTAINTVCQGSAADIMKLAMQKVFLLLKEAVLVDVNGSLSSSIVCDIPWIVLQIHDELLLEVPIERAAYWRDRIQSVMQSTTELSVPLPVHAALGLTWSDVRT